MKLKFLHCLLLACCFSLLSFFVLSFLTKKTVFSSYLLAERLFNNQLEENEVTCQVVLEWKSQEISSQLAIQKINRIFAPSQEWEIDLTKHPLFLLNAQKIGIRDFDNQCQWTVLPVLVELPPENLVNYLWRKLNPF